MLNSAPPAKPKIWKPVEASWSVLSHAVVFEPIATGARKPKASEPSVIRAKMS
jgi:hypothetical protein